MTDFPDGYCADCDHPVGYHSKERDGCTMPVLIGTNTPKGCGDDWETCPCILVPVPTCIIKELPV